MTASKLEDLPNELWLELFVYFTWTELDSTWLEWKLNSRIQTLAQVAHAHVAFEMSSMSMKSYGQCLYYFENKHSAIANHITSLVFNESVLSSEIVRRWLQNGAAFFPRLRYCTIYVYLIGKYVRSNIVRAINGNASTLRRFVFYFNESRQYEWILKNIIQQRISLHTMQLIFVKGMRN
jgi:hypothetical protein